MNESAIVCRVSKPYIATSLAKDLNEFMATRATIIHRDVTYLVACFDGSREGEGQWAIITDTGVAPELAVGFCEGYLKGGSLDEDQSSSLEAGGCDHPDSADDTIAGGTQADTGPNA